MKKQKQKWVSLLVSEHTIIELKKMCKTLNASEPDRVPRWTVSAIIRGAIDGILK